MDHRSEKFAVAGKRHIPLPAELVLHSISQLDPETDRASLKACLLVNSVFWDAAARVLYRRIEVNQPQISLLLAADRPHGSAARSQAGGKRLSDRARKAFSYIRTMHIHGPLAHGDLRSLWASALPGVALFPNVTQLRLQDNLACCPSGYDPIPDTSPPSTVTVFNQPDVCAEGCHSWEQATYLCPNMGAAWCHSSCLEYVIWNIKLPRSLRWRQLRVFEEKLHLIVNGTRTFSSWDSKLLKHAEAAAATHHCDRPPAVQVSLQTDRTMESILKVLAEEDTPWFPTPGAMIEFDVYHEGQEHDCPSCRICSEPLWN